VSLGKRHVATVLDSHEDDLHSRIIAKRDQAFAHSDQLLLKSKSGLQREIVMSYRMAVIL